MNRAILKAGLLGAVALGLAMPAPRRCVAGEPCTECGYRNVGSSVWTSNLPRLTAKLGAPLCCSPGSRVMSLCLGWVLSPL